MAYANQKTSLKERTASVSTVVLVHAGLAVILVAGLKATGVLTTAPPPVVATDIPLDPPAPPPEPDPSEQPERVDAPRDVIVPPRPIELPLQGPIERPISDPAPPSDPAFDPNARDDKPPMAGSSATPTPTPTPAPSPAPTIDPIAAKPSNDASRWVTNDDYPTSSLRREEEGIAAFRVTVSSSGRVTSCEITGSSGHSRLDQATCRQVTRRARFSPARNNRGETIVGTYSSRVRWQIPD